jgi:hypothetical protein
VVPFFNYLQAAFILAEDGRIDAQAVLRVASELIQQHRFDAEALARSYFDLTRRGHIRGTVVTELGPALDVLEGRLPTIAELRRMVEKLGVSPEAGGIAPLADPVLDYAAMAEHHRGGRNRKRN